MLATVVYLAVFGTCMAMLWNEGLWGAGIATINVTIAAALALNYFEPASDYVDLQFPNHTYLIDTLILWGLFAFSMVVLRSITNTISRHRVKFKKPMELVGRGVLAAWVGYLMVGMTCLSLHVAPLPTDMLGGGFQAQPTDNNFFGLAPDRALLAFMHSRSTGALKGAHDFDPQCEFILKYHQRRANFENRAAKESLLVFRDGK